MVSLLPNLRVLEIKVFALVRSDGKMTVWGEAAHGGYIPRALQPSSVASVVLGCRALAVLMTDGRVQSFGDAHWGGDTWFLMTRWGRLNHQKILGFFLRFLSVFFLGGEGIELERQW